MVISTNRAAAREWREHVEQMGLNLKLDGITEPALQLEEGVRKKLVMLMAAAVVAVLRKGGEKAHDHESASS